MTDCLDKHARSRAIKVRDVSLGEAFLERCERKCGGGDDDFRTSRTWGKFIQILERPCFATGFCTFSPIPVGDNRPVVFGSLIDIKASLSQQNSIAEECGMSSVRWIQSFFFRHQ